jgi:hypothetical protein
MPPARTLRLCDTTGDSLKHPFERCCPVDCDEVVSYGNVMACAAHLYGLSAEELSTTELETRDAAFPG